MPIFNLVPCSRCGKRLHYVYKAGMTFTLSDWVCQGCGHKITVWEMDRKMEVERLSTNKNGQKESLFQHIPKVRGNLVGEDILTPVLDGPGLLSSLGEDDENARDLSDLFK